MSSRNHDALPAWRLFIAIELPRPVRHRISQRSERLQNELPDVRASWTREENLHLTLKFLGDTPVDKVEEISQALKAAADETLLFEIEIGGCGAFPPRGKPNVLWIGIRDPSTNLSKLHAAMENRCADVGVAREQRPFHPHLTITRLRQPNGARELAQLHQETGFDPLTVLVEDVCLIRSELSSAGSRYTIIARHKLH